jgi:hypothetical protein
VPDRLPSWIINPRKQDFYVQQKSKDVWHVESEEDCERMLCGHFISVNESVKVSATGGPLKCPDCWMILERARRTVFQ